MRAPLPPDEPARLDALARYQVLDSGAEKSFDDIAQLAGFICKSPIALVSLVDQDRQWFKARLGLDVAETPRDHAFCAHAILTSEVMVVEDATKDARFNDNPLVLGDPHIRFYAGAPLITSDHFKLGSLCVIDRNPRKLSAEEKTALEALSRLVMTALELRRSTRELAESLERVKTLSGLLPICSYCKDIRDDQGYWKRVEEYIGDRTNAEFSHGLCPKCAKIHFPGVHLT
jgi:GAF domain-containing protein